MQKIKQALDAGAGGVIVPMIESAEQLKFIKAKSSWPPVEPEELHTQEQIFLEAPLKIT